MSLWLLFVLMALATARLTRVVVKDDFPPAYWLRSKIVYARPPIVQRTKAPTQDRKRWVNDPSQDKLEFWWLGALCSCAWCASAYVSGGIVFAVCALHGLPLPLLIWAAVWGAGATLAAKIN